MSEEKKKISAIVSVSLLERLRQQSDISTTDAIIQGLELLVDGVTNQPESDNEQTIADFQQIRELETENRVLKEYNETLKKELEDLKEQLKVKDTQLENKDAQLEKQAVHIQTLINQKAIEAPGAKKPWWRFW